MNVLILLYELFRRVRIFHVSYDVRSCGPKYRGDCYEIGIDEKTAHKNVIEKLKKRNCGYFGIFVETSVANF